MKDDISANPRTPSPEIEIEDLLEFEAASQRDPTPELLIKVFEFRDSEPEQLNEMFEAKEAAQICPDLEHPNKIFEFRDPEPEQLNEMSEFGEAAQMDPKQEQPDDVLTEREPLRIIYRKYLRTRRKIAALEGQFRDYNNVDLFLTLYVLPHTGPSGALKELPMLRTILDGQRTSRLFFAELWSFQIPKGTD